MTDIHELGKSEKLNRIADSLENLDDISNSLGVIIRILDRIANILEARS